MTTRRNTKDLRLSMLRNTYIFHYTRLNFASQTVFAILACPNRLTQTAFKVATNCQQTTNVQQTSALRDPLPGIPPPASYVLI